MASTADETDKGTGFGVLFFLLAAFGAVVMFSGEGLTSAFGFGGAVLFGILLVVAIHLYA